MRRWILILCACFLVLAPVAAAAKSPRALLQDGNVRVRVSTEPGRRVLIGQQTRFFVEILTDTWFTTAPEYPELVLDGAVALMPEQMGTNFTERIGRETFAAQRRSYVIFPQRAGPLEIPAIRIRLAVSENGKAGTPFTLRTQPLKLSVVLPAEAEGIDGLVTTPRLRVREDWSRPLEGLKVGDAIKRTIRMDADRALGMLLPELRFDVPEGIAVYPDPPRLEDQVNRGQYKGRRTETVTYVLQRPGEFTVPEIQLHWWSPGRSRLTTETLSARTLNVEGTLLPNPAGADEPVPWWASWRGDLERLWAWMRAHALLLAVGCAAFLTGIAILWRVLPALVARRRSVLHARPDSERQLFDAMRKSARKGDLDGWLRNFWRWREQLLVELPGCTTDDLRRAADETGFSTSWAEVEESRYGAGASSISARRLHRQLQKARQILRATPIRDREDSALRLNPKGETQRNASPSPG